MRDRTWQPPVLLIEDDYADLELATQTLGQAGLGRRLQIARNADEALARLGQWQQGMDLPQVILLDLALPDGQGLDILRRIKQHSVGRTIPVVVFSSSCDQTDIRAAYDSGACSFVTKPHQLADYVRSLGELLAYWCGLNTTYAASLQ